MPLPWCSSRSAEAVPLLQGWLSRQPGDAAAWQCLGLAQLLLGEPAAAAGSLRQALVHQTGDPRAWSLLGVACAQSGQHDEAVDCFDRAVALDPAQPQLWHDRGRALFDAGRTPDALDSFERALALDSGHAPAWLSHGLMLRELGRLPQALQSLRRAQALAPQDVGVLHGLAETLVQAGRDDEALPCCALGVRLQPAHDGLWTTYGNALLSSRHPQQALACYETAVRLQPCHVQAWIGQSRALRELGRSEASLRSLERAAELAPDLLTIVPALMGLYQRMVVWDRLPALWRKALQGLDVNCFADARLPMLAHPDASGRDLLRGGLAFADATRGHALLPRPAPAPKPPDARLRIGYLSADFTEHPMAYLMAGVFEAHDRRHFDVVGIDIASQPPPDSAMRRRLQQSLGPLVELGNLPTERALQRLKALQVDILVDLMGVTRHARIDLLFQRPAPVMVSYLGYPGTSGIAELDYIIGDRWVTPAAAAADFSECIVTLPDSFQANDQARAMAPDAPGRGALDLPEDAFVFCCLNNTYKVLPRMFDIWMRLLARVPGSVLWLVQDSEVASRHLRQQAAARGIAPERLVFAQRAPYPVYLAQYRRADLFLDTLPFNAGTTASDALWAGLPVLTQAGQTFAGRMAASLLDAVGLPELITHSDADYEALALRLATEPALLAGYRERLRAHGPRSALFDTARFTRHLESAYRTLWARQAQGLPPASFAVDPLDE